MWKNQRRKFANQRWKVDFKHNNPQRKRTWIRRGEQVQQCAKPGLKVLFSVSWDYQGILFSKLLLLDSRTTNKLTIREATTTNRKIFVIIMLGHLWHRCAKEKKNTTSIWLKKIQILLHLWFIINKPNKLK